MLQPTYCPRSGKFLQGTHPAQCAMQEQRVILLLLRTALHISAAQACLYAGVASNLNNGYVSLTAQQLQGLKPQSTPLPKQGCM